MATSFLGGGRKKYACKHHLNLAGREAMSSLSRALPCQNIPCCTLRVFCTCHRASLRASVGDLIRKPRSELDEVRSRYRSTGRQLRLDSPRACVKVQSINIKTNIFNCSPFLSWCPTLVRCALNTTSHVSDVPTNSSTFRIRREVSTNARLYFSA